MSKSILFLTSDLMMQSSASAAAKNRQVQIRSCGTVNKLQFLLQDEPLFQAVFVDLQTRGLQIDALVKSLEDQTSASKIAFAQHVEEQLLTDPRLKVFDKVMTRGQFNHKLPDLIASI